MIPTIEILKLVIPALGIPAVLVAAFKGIAEIRSNTREKKRENRHKQAAAARDILKDLFSNERARAAMQMLDWSGRNYTDGTSSFTIHTNELAPALRTHDAIFLGPEGEKQKYIRDCFEEFYDKVLLMEHYVNIDFLHFSDVAVPLAYYAQIIVRSPSTYHPFLKDYGYEGALAFFEKAALLRKNT